MIERENRWGRQGDRDAGRNLEQVTPELGGVIRCAASGENDEIYLPGLELAAQLLSLRPLGAQSAFDRLWLLPDLFAHRRHARKITKSKGKEC